MVDTYLLRSIKRVHDECERALQEENYKVNQSLANRFNDILEKYKTEYPDNHRIQEIEEIEGVSVGRGPGRVQSAMDRVQEVKLATLKITDLLELDTQDFEELSQSDKFAVINVNQEQTQEQEQTQAQWVTVENILNDIDGMMTAPEDKEELKDLVREFEEELDSDDPEPSRLQRIIAKVKGYSDDIAKKLIMMATQRGVYILLGLL